MTAPNPTFFLFLRSPDSPGLEEFIYRAWYKLGLDNHQFSAIEVIAQSDEPGLIILDEDRFLVPGHLVRCRMEQVTEVLRQKVLHEHAAFRVPGHRSKHAPEFLKKDACVFVVGEAIFLAHNMHLYLEHYGLLRKKLIGVLKALTGLSQTKFVRVSVPDERFYPGNLNALVERVSARRIPSDRLLKELQSHLDETEARERARNPYKK